MSQPGRASYILCNVESIEFLQNPRTCRLTRAYLIYLSRGNATASRDGRNRVFRAPCTLAVPGRHSEKLEVLGESVALSIETGLWDELDEDFREDGIILPVRVEGVALDAADGGFVAACMNQMRGAGDISCLKVEEYRLSVLKTLLIFFHRRLNSSLDDRSLWNISDVVIYIESHYSDQFTLDFFASRCAMNHSSFSRAFKDLMGHTLFEYINRVKIRHACRLLKREARSVLDISFSLGYNNISFFNRYFKRVTGLSPSEFRKSK